MAEMQDALQAEFDRLGIDPDKVTAKAPQKEENAVFDFTGTLEDPDGEGGDPPTGITLTWTERLIADYNQDGMVTANDLTPIGQNYCFETGTPQVTYNDPGDHNGIEYWPAGDPDDGAGGSLNWRLAVVDGNNDGRILMHDITPIAVHYEERLTGYRVWRKAPGGSFEIIPNPDDAGSEVTISRPDASGPNAPVRYSISDTDATATGLGEGSYAYYVQPWDGTSSTGGPVSAVVVIDNTGTVTPEQPVAQLAVTPDYGGAPVVVTLDASGSTDSDGTVEVWHWDFDADGITDWVSTDAVPEVSSAGTVDTITPVSDGVVTVTYNQGSADWYFPSVIVIDNDGLDSLPAHSQLGVTGWEFEEIFSSDNPMPGVDYLANVLALDRNPTTGEIIFCDKANFADDHLGFAFATRTEQNQWAIEPIPAYDDPVYRDFCPSGVLSSLNQCYIQWLENGDPVAFMIMDIGFMEPVRQPFVGRRIGGEWRLTRLTEAGEFSDVDIWAPIKVGPDHFAVKFRGASSEGKVNGVIEWDHGTVRQYDPGYPEDDGEGNRYGSAWFYSDATDRIYIYLTRHTSSSGQINEPIVRFWVGTPEEGWHWEVHDYSDLWPYDPDECYIEGIHLNPDGTPIVGAVRSEKSWSGGEGLYVFGQIQGQRQLMELKPSNNWWLTPLRHSFSAANDCIWSSGGHFYREGYGDPIPGIQSRVIAFNLSGGELCQEIIAETPMNGESSGISIRDISGVSQHEAVALLRSDEWQLVPSLEYVDAYFDAHYLGIRLDPR